METVDAYRYVLMARHVKKVSVSQKQKNVNEWPYLNWNLFQASAPPCLDHSGEQK